MNKLTSWISDSTRCKYKVSKNKVNWTDYSYVILASIISSCGFLSDSETVVIGSMLISPLLKPIINLAISFVKNETDAIFSNIIYAGQMIILCSLCSYIVGSIFAIFYPNKVKDFKKALTKSKDNNKVVKYNTILSRNVLSYVENDAINMKLYIIILIAICGGILLALTNCIEGDLTTVIIGAGISTSILPPIVAGSIWASFEKIGDLIKFEKDKVEAIISGIGLGLLNIALIFSSFFCTLFLI